MESSCESFEKCYSDVRIDRRKNQRSLLINSGLSVFIRYISCKDIPNLCKVARNEAKMYCLFGTEWLEVSAIAERLLLYNKLLYKDLTCENSLHLYYLISAKLIYARHHRDTSFIDFPQSIRHLELATQFTLNSLIAERNLEYNLSKLWITGANYFGLNYNSPKLVSNSKINCCYVKSIPDYFVEKSNGERLGWNLNISEVPVTSVYYNNMQRSHRFLEAALILKVNETDPAWYPMLRAMKCEYNSLHYCYLAEVTPQHIEKATLLNTAAATMQQASVMYLRVYDNPMSEISLLDADGLMSDALVLYAAIDNILPILKERIKHASVIIEQCISMESSSKVAMLWKHVRQEYTLFLTENYEMMNTLLKAKSRSQIHDLQSVITSIPPNILQLTVILPILLYFEQLIVRRDLYLQTLVEAETVDGSVDFGEYKLLLQDCRRKALFSIEKAVEIYQTALSTADYSTVVFEQIQLRAESYEKLAIYYSKLATCLLLPSSSYLLESRCAKSLQETEMWLKAQTYLYEGVRHGIQELDTLTTDINTSVKDITFSLLVSSFEHRASYCVNAAKYLRRRNLLPEDSDMSLLLTLSVQALQLNIEYWGINNCELALWPICKYYGYIELTKTMLAFCDRADDIHPLLHPFCLCVEKGLNSSFEVEVSAWYKASRYIVDALTNNCVSFFWGLNGLRDSISNEMKAYCAASEANAVTNNLLFETVIFTKISKLQREIKPGMLYDDNSEHTLYLNVLLVEHAERHGCIMTSIMPKPQIATKLPHSPDQVEKVQAIFVEAQCVVAQAASAYKHKWKKVISWAAKVSKQCNSPHLLSIK